MEQKSRLGKVSCCGTCWGWLAAGVKVRCPTCGKMIDPIIAKSVAWAVETKAAAIRQKNNERNGGSKKCRSVTKS